MLNLFRKGFIGAYRIAAVITLYGLLIGIGAYASLMSFYALNKSWVAPISISPSNDKILQMKSQMVQSEQAVETLNIGTSGLVAGNKDLTQRRATLVDLRKELEQTATRQRDDNRRSGEMLTALLADKRKNLTDSKTMLVSIDGQMSDIDKNLKAGLVTRSEAVGQRTALVEFRNNYTNEQVAQVALEDMTKQKMQTDLSNVDTRAKMVELDSQIATIDLTLQANNLQIHNNEAQITSITQTIRTASDNPYAVAAALGRVEQVAFVSFDNEASIHVAAPVYDCSLSFVWCHQVGNVTRVFNEEEHAENPIFKSSMRGFMVELALTNTDSAKSKTLFVGSKPMGL